MTNENTSTRLKEIMKERNLRQVDLLEMVKPYCEKYNVKVNKSDISQYLSGKVKPGQEKLSMISMALNVNETWLMGYDVSKEKQLHSENKVLSNEENLLLQHFNALDLDDKNKVIDYTKLLSSQDKYKKVVKLSWEENNKAHLMPIACHDDNLTEDEKYNMNNIIDEYIKNI